MLYFRRRIRPLHQYHGSFNHPIPVNVGMMVWLSCRHFLAPRQAFDRELAEQRH